MLGFSSSCLTTCITSFENCLLLLFGNFPTTLFFPEILWDLCMLEILVLFPNIFWKYFFSDCLKSFCLLMLLNHNIFVCFVLFFGVVLFLWILIYQSFFFMASGLHYMFRELFLIQNNFAAALLKYNLYTTKFTLLKYII